jgi:hypothetical protein
MNEPRACKLVRGRDVQLKKTNLDMQRKKASLWPWPMLKTRETVRPVERELRFMVDLARTGCETGCVQNIKALEGEKTGKEQGMWLLCGNCKGFKVAATAGCAMVTRPLAAEQFF